MDHSMNPIDVLRDHLIRNLNLKPSFVDKFLTALVAKLPTALYGQDASLVAKGIAGAMLSFGMESNITLNEEYKVVARLSYMSTDDIPSDIGQNKGPIFVDKIDMIVVCRYDISPFDPTYEPLARYLGNIINAIRIVAANNVAGYKDRAAIFFVFTEPPRFCDTSELYKTIPLGIPVKDTIISPLRIAKHAVEVDILATNEEAQEGLETILNLIWGAFYDKLNEYLNDDSIARIETILNDKEVSNPFAFLTVAAAASYVKGYEEVNKEALDLALSIIKP